MKAVTIALALLSIACVITLSWVLATPPPADPRVASLEGDLKAAKQKISELQQELSRRPQPPAPAIVSKTPAPKPGNELANALAATSSQPAPTKGANLREMMANPAMRTMIDQQQAMQVDIGYARLFEYLQLNEDEKNHFRKLLTDRLKAETDIGLKLMEPNLTADQRKELAEQLRQQKGAYNESIKGFLNSSDDWGAFQQWEDTQPERMQLNTIGRSLFSASGEPLTQQQEDQLINVMSEIRKTAPAPAATGTPEQVVQSQIKQMEANAKTVYERAQTFLSPTQLRTLQNFQQQSQSMTRTGLEMSQMFMNQR